LRRPSPGALAVAKDERYALSGPSPGALVVAKDRDNTKSKTEICAFVKIYKVTKGGSTGSADTAEGVKKRICGRPHPRPAYHPSRGPQARIAVRRGRVLARRAVRGSFGVAPSTILARTCGTHGLLLIGRYSHVDIHVLVEVVHRAAADVDVGVAQLHNASTHRLCELSDDEIQRKHRITVNQQHSLTSSLAHHLIHDSRV